MKKKAEDMKLKEGGEMWLKRRILPGFAVSTVDPKFIISPFLRRK